MEAIGQLCARPDGPGELHLCLNRGSEVFSVDRAERAVRFGLFHPMGSVGDSGEAGVRARGIGGNAYRGHVFWDGDVFVLPFLAATHPAFARAMLEYRVRRLPAA